MTERQQIPHRMPEAEKCIQRDMDLVLREQGLQKLLDHDAYDVLLNALRDTAMYIMEHPYV